MLMFTSMHRQTGRHTPHRPPTGSDVKTMVFTDMAPAPTCMSGAPLRPHLAHEEYCHYVLRETEAWRVTESAMR